MRIGIFGDEADAQCQAVAREARALGADVVFIQSDALQRGLPLSFLDDQTFQEGESLDDLRGFYVRFIPAPMVPALERDERLVLYEDWYTQFMHAREHASFYMAWLLRLQHAGATLVNAPHAASVMQFKPFQLSVLRGLGARVPRTLVSNRPAEVRAFHAQHPDVIYKPLIGGAYTRPLDAEALERLEAIRASPVIFQERIEGEDLRVTLVGDELVSCVAIDTPERHLDFRADPAYQHGQARYREVVLPSAIQDLCRKAARACGLIFTGIDIKHRGDDYVFLELNSSPVYLEVEVRTGHPISRGLARYIVDGARSHASP